MSTFDNAEYQWRETFFVFHKKSDRPLLDDVKDALEQVGQNLELRESRADDEGRLESLTILAPAAFAAIDLSYADEEELEEQLVTLQKEMQPQAKDEEELDKVRKLTSCDARLDLLHFEQVMYSNGNEEMDAFFDPTALLIVIETLSDLCNGVGVDPASATIV